MCLIQGRSQQDKRGPPYLRKNRFAYMVQSVLLKNRRRPKIPETVSLNTAWPGPRIPDQTDDAKLKRFKVYHHHHHHHHHQFYFRQRLYGLKEKKPDYLCHNVKDESKIWRARFDKMWPSSALRVAQFYSAQLKTKPGKNPTSRPSA